MANSIEVRAPFLDVDLFKASCKIPRHLLIDQNGNGKSIKIASNLSLVFLK